MQQMLLAHGGLSDAATITGPNGAGDLVIGNLKKQSLQQPYRVIGNTFVIDVDLGAVKSINLIALIGHNGTPTCKVRVTAGSSIGSQVYNSGLISAITGTKAFPKSLFCLYLPNAVNYRYWRIEFVDTVSPFIDIGRLYISSAFQPTYNMVYGFSQGFIDASQEFETNSGDSIPLRRKKKRFADFSLEDLSDAEVFGPVYALDQLVGVSGDVLFVPAPEDTTYLQQQAFYGKIEALNPNQITSFARYARQYRIKELLP